MVAMHGYCSMHTLAMHQSRLSVLGVPDSVMSSLINNGQMVCAQGGAAIPPAALSLMVVIPGTGLTRKPTHLFYKNSLTVHSSADRIAFGARCRLSVLESPLPFPAVPCSAPASTSRFTTVAVIVVIVIATAIVVGILIVTIRSVSMSSAGYLQEQQYQHMEHHYPNDSLCLNICGQY